MAETDVKLPTSNVYAGPNTIASAMLFQVEEANRNYANVAAKLAAADGDRETAVKTWVETTDLAQAVKLREQISKLNEQLNNLADKHVKEIELTDEDKAKLNEELKTLRTGIKDSRMAVEMVIKTISTDSEGVLKALEDIGDQSRSGKGRPVGTPGAKGPRVSATVTITGGNFTEPQVYDGLSKAATGINGDTKALQEAYAAAAKVEWLEIAKVDKVLDFEFQPGEGRPVYKVHTEPKERAKPNTAKAATVTATAPAKPEAVQAPAAKAS
jgi:hypothetical protein